MLTSLSSLQPSILGTSMQALRLVSTSTLSSVLDGVYVINDMQASLIGPPASLGGELVCSRNLSGLSQLQSELKESDASGSHVLSVMAHAYPCGE